jgi:hypothetical protein
MSTTLNKYKKNIGRGINLWLNGPVLIVGVVWQKEMFARRCWHYRCKSRKGNYTVPCHAYRYFISEEKLAQIKAELV